MQRALRQCKSLGCTELTRDPRGYCEEHMHLVQEKHNEYQRYRTDKKEQAFYRSSEWLKIRMLALNRDHGLCQHCLKDGIIKVADMVHHKIEVKNNWSLRLVLDNLISLCNSCHNKVPRGSGSEVKM